MVEIFTGVLTLISAIAAAVTAFATLRVVTEMSKQRTQTLLPQLYLSGMRFVTNPVEFLNGDTKNIGNLIKWRVTSGPDKNDDSRIEMRVSNLGLGAAVNVRVSWHFTYRHIMERTSDFAQHSEIAIPPELTSSAASVRVRAYDPDEREQVFPYILPSTVEKQSSLLKIPERYVQAVIFELYVVHTAFYFQRTYLKHDPFTQAIPHVPPLILFIGFEDIAGNKYSQSYEIDLGLMWVRADSGFALSGEMRPSLKAKTLVSDPDYHRIA
jgi:hypothetical protein